MRVSAPAPPLRTLLPVLPVMILFRLLPVPLIAVVPVKVRFSRWFFNVQVIEDSTVSIP